MRAAGSRPSCCSQRRSNALAVPAADFDFWPRRNPLAGRRLRPIASTAPQKAADTLLQFLPSLSAIRRRATLPGQRNVRRAPKQTEAGLDER